MDAPSAAASHACASPASSAQRRHAAPERRAGQTAASHLCDQGQKYAGREMQNLRASFQLPEGQHLPLAWASSLIPKAPVVSVDWLQTSPPHQQLSKVQVFGGFAEKLAAAPEERRSTNCKEPQTHRSTAASEGSYLAVSPDI